MAALFYGAGKGREGKGRQLQNSFDYWVCGEEQQPRISRMRLASTVFLSRHKSAVLVVFHSRLLTAVQSAVVSLFKPLNHR